MNTWAHLHRDSHVALTIYSLCPIKQFSIAFLRSLGDVKITVSGICYGICFTKYKNCWISINMAPPVHHTGDSIGLQQTTI